MTHTIEIRDETFVLHPSGVVFWKEQNTVLISDVHLGKVAHFRKHGIAIPNGAVHENFFRLTAVMEFFMPSKIIFLGDLFHSKINSEWNLFASWTNKFDAEIILVEGNHDIIDKQWYSELNIMTFPELTIGNFLLTHFPEEREGTFNFCGHIHPGIALRGIGRQSLKLPCFFQKKCQMILPAFGEFTGNFYLVPTGNDIVYAIAKDKVLLVAVS